jgi:aspartate/methionine/tyrosine aminotransferase
MQLPPFKLESFFRRYEFRTEFILCGSDCETLSVGEILALEPEAAEKFKTLRLGYTETQGNPALRGEISRLYETIAPHQILVHSGAEEAIFIFLHALLEPNDHIIVHQPAYQSLSEIARKIGCRVCDWTAREENDWKLDVEELRRLICPETKLIIINTPHNPTGFLMSPEDFRAVLKLADDNKIVVFSDEVYRESEHDPADRLPAACDLSDRAISLGVMSKTYGLAGLRIGWIAARNSALIERMMGLKDYTTICNSAPGEFLAEIALRNRRRIISRNLGIIRANLSLLDEFFNEFEELFEWKKPRAGSIGFPGLFGENIEEFCERLVQNAGVLLLPGTVFGDTANHFRIGFGRLNMPAALTRLREFLN